MWQLIPVNVISFVSSQRDFDAFSFYFSIVFVSHTLLFRNLVYFPAPRVLVSVGSVATELAETGTKSCHVVAAAGIVSS